MLAKDLLKEPEYTMAELARALKVCRQTVYNWKNHGVDNRITGRKCWLKTRQKGGGRIVTRDAYLTFDAAQNRLYEEDP